MIISKKKYVPSQFSFLCYYKNTILTKLLSFIYAPRSSVKGRLRQIKLINLFLKLVDKFSMTYFLEFHTTDEGKKRTVIKSKDLMLYIIQGKYYATDGGNLLFFILKTLSPKLKSFYDLGSNNGCGGGAFFLAATGFTKKIVAVEPNPIANQVFNKIKQSIFNKKTNISIFTSALSDHSTQAYIHSSMPNWSGYAKLNNNGDGNKVHVTTLDNLIEENKLPLPDFIKIDCENEEYKILVGAIKSINKSKPAIYFENGVCLSKRENKKIINLLNDLGYVLYLPTFVNSSKDIWSFNQCLPALQTESFVGFIPEAHRLLEHRHPLLDLNFLAVHKSRVQAFFKMF